MGVWGKQRVVRIVVPATIDAAVVSVADAEKRFRICYRQVMEQDGIDQRKDGRVGTDAEGGRKQHRNGEPPRLSQLAECIPQILQQNSHSQPPYAWASTNKSLTLSPVWACAVTARGIVTTVVPV